MPITQAIILHKDWFTLREAENWIHRHRYHPIKKVHSTLNFWRFRLKEPNENIYDYRIIKLRDGVKAVIGFKKN